MRLGQVVLIVKRKEREGVVVVETGGGMTVMWNVVEIGTETGQIGEMSVIGPHHENGTKTGGVILVRHPMVQRGVLVHPRLLVAHREGREVLSGGKGVDETTVGEDTRDQGAPVESGTTSVGGGTERSLV